MTQPQALDQTQAHLMNDAEVARFVVNGYHIIEPEFADGFNQNIAQQLDQLSENPGDAITEAVPQLNQVLTHPAVLGVLTSLLGHDYQVAGHRHWHNLEPQSPSPQPTA
jgi:hypothetical protein